MDAVIQFKDGRTQVYKTAGESGVSSDALAASIAPKYKSIAVLYDIRFDLFETEGLRIDILWYSATEDAGTLYARADSFGLDKLPVLSLERGFAWHILPKEELDEVESIEIDGGQWKIQRYNGVLVNETRFKMQVNYWLGKNKQEDSVLNQITSLHETIRSAHPEWDDEQIARSYGFPRKSWASAAADERIASAIDVESASTDFVALVANSRMRHPTKSLNELFNHINEEAEIISYEDLKESWKQASDLAGLSDDVHGEPQPEAEDDFAYPTDVEVTPEELFNERSQLRYW